MRWIILGTSLASAVAMADGNLFVEFDHYSKLLDGDYGLSMANVGVEGCNKYNLCLEGKIGTPVFDNDMYKDRFNFLGEDYGRNNLDTGDVMGGISLKYKFMSW